VSTGQALSLVTSKAGILFGTLQLLLLNWLRQQQKQLLLLQQQQQQQVHNQHQC